MEQVPRPFQIVPLQDPATKASRNPGRGTMSRLPIFPSVYSLVHASLFDRVVCFFSFSSWESKSDMSLEVSKTKGLAARSSQRAARVRSSDRVNHTR